MLLVLLFSFGFLFLLVRQVLTCVLRSHVASVRAARAFFDALWAVIHEVRLSVDGSSEPWGRVEAELVLVRGEHVGTGVDGREVL